MTKLYITRHGQTEWNLEGRLQGHQNSNLTKLGKSQANALGERLMGESIDLILSSPSGRTIETSNHINAHLSKEIIYRNDLIEMNLGNWEGRKRDEIAEEFEEENYLFWQKPHLYTPYSGESYHDVMLRVSRELSHIAKTYRGMKILVVTHAIIHKMILKIAKDLPLEKLWSGNPMEPTCLSLIEVSDNTYSLLFECDISHLKK